MEELQDAIEDAQYMNALHDVNPKPIAEWKIFPIEKLQAYIDNVGKLQPKLVTLEAICARPVGFYLFTRFVRDRGYIACGDFLMDTAKYRTCANLKRLKVASKIKTDYLINGSIGRRNRTSAINLCRKLPPPSTTPTTAPASYAVITSSSDGSVNNAVTVDDVITGWKEYINPPAPCIAPAPLEGGSGTYSSPSTVAPAPGTEDTYLAGDPNPCDNLNPVESENLNSLGLIGSPLAEVIFTINESLAQVIRRSNDLALGDDENSVSCPRAVPDLVRTAAASNPNYSSLTPPNETNGSRSRSASIPQSLNSMSVTLFDVLDTIVYRFLETELWTAFQTSSHWERYWQFVALSELPVVEDDFSLFRVLGRGGFGLVNMCKRAASGKLFAMKQMNKRRVKMKKAENLCLNERNILAAIDSPYVVCLKYAFATTNELYLILDLMMGGDLGFHLTRRKRFNEVETKFFAARTLMGIVALHEKSIVYRDLKPENILMDNDGYTRISDLGLAASIDNRVGMVGTCGTRGYWAPDMLRRDEAGRREKYFQVVDWFSFGCLVYEFVYGCGPFRTLKARQFGQIPPKAPANMTKEERDRSIDAAILEMEPEFDSPFFQGLPVLVDMIRRLLKKNPTERLGWKGHQEIMNHAYFKSIDWDQVMFMRPPWRPARNINMAPQQEIGTFADEKQSNRMVVLPEDHQIYEGWNFINVKAFEEEVVEYLRYEEAGKMVIHAHNHGCCSVS